MTNPKQKIFIDEKGAGHVAMVPDAFLEWSKDKPAEEVGRFMQWVIERAHARDEGALADVPFLATAEHKEAWEDGFSVSPHEQ